MLTRTLTLALALATACATRPELIDKPVERKALDTSSAEKYQQVLAEADAAWMARSDEARLREALAKWEQVVVLKPDDATTYAKLARGYYLLADGFLSFDPDRRTDFLAAHEKGQAVAEQGLRALSPDFERRRAAGTKIENAMLKLSRDAVPLMYWYDVNLGKWAKAQGIAETLKYKDRIFKIMTRIYDLDPDYFFSAPDRYFGAFYAVAPDYAGGDLEKSRHHFDLSLTKSPNYLATHVLIAETYAPKVQDRRLFEAELKFVLEAPANVIPEMEAEALIEKKKAQKLLAEADERF